MRNCRQILVVCALLAGAVAGLRAEEPLPPRPRAHFNDYAGVVPEAEARRLDERLAAFERETSTQVVVAVFPRLPSPSLEDFTVRTAEAWGVGGRKYDNGAILFVFVADRKMRIETGYGLEGALPDQLGARILDERVRPRFQAGDFAGGLEAGIDGILAATRGEYKSEPGQAPAREGRSSGLSIVVLVVFVVLFLWLSSLGSRGYGRTYAGRAHRRGGYWGGWGGSGGGGFGGGGFGGGGGFSGGGGSFGGGGASSSW